MGVISEKPAIDPKTLTINSHVEYRGERTKVVEISRSITGADLSLLDADGMIVYNNVPHYEVEPIPITPELLKELGFKYHEYDNGKLWEMEFADGFHSHLNLEFDEDTTGIWEANLWDCKELVVNARIEFLHELENYVYLVYNKELIQD